MDEITGPIIAITLVLCSVFLPCAFIPGITGQFFRQFALTIAASMIISAINAMTLTPVAGRRRSSKAPSVDEHGHPKREALPWWIFGVLRRGGCVYWLGTKFFAGPAGRSTASTPKLSSATLALTSRRLPGAIAGGVVGWFIIRPVNSRPGPRSSGPSTAASTGSPTPTAPSSARAARVSAASCWSSTAACCSSPCCAMSDGAHGVHPDAGPGLPAGQRAAARLRLACSAPAR